MDKIDSLRRSENMRRIRGKNTEPELAVRLLVRELGVSGYRIHRKDLPGKPDIAWIGRKLAIFVHGCFWHGHQACRKKALPKSNKAFWMQKITGNKARDQRAKRQLKRLGWRSLTIWECRTKDLEKVKNSLERYMVS